MADTKPTAHRGKDARPRKSYVKLPAWIREKKPGETKEEFFRRYSNQRYHYLKEHDPDFMRRNCESVAAAAQRNPERHKEKKLAYCERNRESEKQRAAKWFAENRDRGLETRREHYKANKEAHKAKTKEWVANNPEANQAIKENYRARRLNAPGAFSGDDIKEILAAQKGRCAICGAKLTKRKTVDHIMPLSLGGTNDRRNLQIVCFVCNTRKGAKHPLRFARELGLLL